MNLVQILLKILSFLFELKVLPRYRTFKLPVLVFGFVQLHLQLDNFINFDFQVVSEYLHVFFVFLALGFEFLLDLHINNFLNIWLLFLELLIKGRF